MRTLTPGDRGVLRALRSPRAKAWMTSQEIAEFTELAPYVVRSSLGFLRRNRLVARGQDIDHAGMFHITEAGTIALAAADQLRLVR